MSQNRLPTGVTDPNRENAPRLKGNRVRPLDVVPSGNNIKQDNCFEQGGIDSNVRWRSWISAKALHLWSIAQSTYYDRTKTNSTQITTDLPSVELRST